MADNNNQPKSAFMAGEDGVESWNKWAGHFVDRGSKRVWIMGHKASASLIPWGSAQTMEMAKGIIP